MCSNRDDELLEELKVIALSRGANSSQLTEHMFGPASADVYGKIPLEDGIVDVWLRNQLALPADVIFEPETLIANAQSTVPQNKR